MKNLINIGVERLMEVPIEHLSVRPTQAKKAEWFGLKYHHHSGYYKLGHNSPWKIAFRIIEKNLGKSFDAAFSYYCKIVPKIYQKKFLEEFDSNGRRCDPSYIIDKNGNIQDNPLNPWKGRYKRRKNNYQGPYTIESKDFRSEMRHKVTGHPQSEFTGVYEKIPYEQKRVQHKKRTNSELWEYVYYYTTEYKNGKFLYYEYGSNPLRMKLMHERYRANKDDFHSVIVQGWQKVFESKKDPEFIRLQAEKRKESKILSKKEKIERDQKVYDMISKTELEKKKQKELNDQVIVRHGFDLVTSFRG